MNVGFIGLGNLGLPCALAIEHFGRHTIYGWDCNPIALLALKTGTFARIEPNVELLLSKTRIRICPIAEIARSCDIVFVAVQTPHQPQFAGITPLSEERSDFDYSFLIAAVKELADSAFGRRSPLLINIVSTVLPGTIRRDIEPLLNEFCSLCYNPFFIAMGTTIADLMDPEFVLLGSRDKDVLSGMQQFYSTLHGKPCLTRSIEAAEIIKVSYNTFIGLKLAFVNCLMEVSEKVGANVDDVTDALCLATDRVISTRYMRAGMGDGGGCHPRDNIAMSFLSRELDLSFDLFEAAMLAREGHARWLADQVTMVSQNAGLPIVLLGKAYKADSDLSMGSPGLLLNSILEERGVESLSHDPFIDAAEFECSEPAVFFIAANHGCFKELPLPSGSIVIDPWGEQPERPGVTLCKLGRS